MRWEFLENLCDLLKDSLTLQRADFPRKSRYQAFPAAAASRIRNRAFTMNPLGEAAAANALSTR
jgi:hypothetical protein